VAEFTEYEADEVATQTVTDWATEAKRDQSLRAYVDAEIARAVVELDSVKWKLEHQQRVIASLERKVSDLESRKRS